MQKQFLLRCIWVGLFQQLEIHLDICFYFIVFDNYKLFALSFYFSLSVLIHFVFDKESILFRFNLDSS